MDEQDFQNAVLNYVIHISDNQTRLAEAMLALGQQMTTMNRHHQETMATLSTQNQAIAAILERVVQTTDRTEQMVARILAGTAPEKVSH